MTDNTATIRSDDGSLSFNEAVGNRTLNLKINNKKKNGNTNLSTT